jgi:flagellar motor switch protein FliG
MAIRTGIEKAALLLYSLPPEAADKVLAALGHPRSERLRSELGKLRQHEAPPNDVGDVVREFEEMLRQVEAPPPPPPPPPRPIAAYRPPPEPVSAPPEEPELPSSPSDPVEELLALSPEMLAAALQGEQAHTIALVLNDLPPEKAGETLQRLSPEMRREASVRLSRLNSSSPELLARIARALVQKKHAPTIKRTDTSADAKYKKMASMLRSLDEAELVEVLNALEEHEPETARHVKELLWRFEDLLRIHDRSLQKLLAEIDSKTLSVALKGANDAIIEKLMANMSKRACETLKEEMEFVGMVPLPQVRQAQKVVVDAIQRLDQAGELMMIE